MRLIDADKLLIPDEESNKVFIIGARSGKTLEMALDLLKIKVNSAPTIDAVPVVRCKDCKFFNMHEKECECGYVATDLEGGAQFRINFDLDDFCSFGERR